MAKLRDPRGFTSAARQAIVRATEETMTRTLTASLLITAVLVASAPSHAANPLAPLGRFQAQLVKAMNAVIKGTDPKKAFAPLPAVAKGTGVADLKTSGATSVTILAMEVELVYFVGDVPTYYLRTAVSSTKKGPAFVGFAGRPIENGKAFVTSHPFATFKGPVAPLGATGAALAKAVAGKACLALPIASAADFGFLPAGKMADRARKDLERTRASMPAECAKLAALKPSKVQLRIDDIAFAGIGADGQMKGMLKSDIERDGEKAVLEIGRFRAPR
jgi:hypothetical protein